MNRIGVIAVIIERTDNNVEKVNKILSDFAHDIKGRMGIPEVEDGLNVISVIVESDSDKIGAVTGKLGRIPGVSVKSMLAPPKNK